MRIAALPAERWARKAAEWNPSLSTKYKTYRVVGRPKKGCEDEINEFLRTEGIEEETNNDERNNDVGSRQRKIRMLEENGKQFCNDDSSSSSYTAPAQKENGWQRMTFATVMASSSEDHYQQIYGREWQALCA